MSMCGYGTPPPQDRARIAHDLMNNVFIYRLLTYFTGIIDIMAVDLGVFLVSVLSWSSVILLRRLFLCSLLVRGTFPLSLPVWRAESALPVLLCLLLPASPA